jgi:hypothetical protein
MDYLVWIKEAGDIGPKIQIVQKIMVRASPTEVLNMIVS